MTIDVAIVGGGVSGLTAAYELQRLGWTTRVLERQIRVGGNILSERIGGFLMEHGPSSIVASASSDALTDTLGIAGQACPLSEQVRARYLTGGGRLHGISTHPLGFLTADYLSPAARLRLLMEPFVKRRTGGDEETVDDFVTRRFGRAMAERVTDPLVGGLYAGLAKDVSVSAVFPKLVEMERRFGSVALGVLKSRRGGKARMPGRRLHSFRDGLATLPRALDAALGPSVVTGAPVLRIQRRPSGFRLTLAGGEALEAKAVVLATQPHMVASLLESLDPVAAAAASEIDAPPLAAVFLGYRRAQIDHPLDGLGYLTPSSERSHLTGALFCSTMYPDRAPLGHVSFCAYIGGDRAPALAQRPPEELTALAVDELRDLLGAKGRPVVSRVRQWHRGLPQYRLGHGQRLARIRGGEGRLPGLFVTGNFVSGPGIARCIDEAQVTAERASEFLAGLQLAATTVARSQRRQG